MIDRYSNDFLKAIHENKLTNDNLLTVFNQLVDVLGLQNATDRAKRLNISRTAANKHKPDTVINGTKYFLNNE